MTADYSIVQFALMGIADAALIGILALLVKRPKIVPAIPEAASSASPAEPPAVHAAHAGCIEVVEFDEDGTHRVISTHEGGMRNFVHHEEVKAALRDPRYGVKWESGHIERGRE